MMDAYNPYGLTPEGLRRSMDPSERAAGSTAVALLERSLGRIGLMAIAFLPISQPEREAGEKVWRLTAVGGKLRRGLVVSEATLNDPDALDAFLRQHTTDDRKAA